MKSHLRTSLALFGLTAAFLLLSVAFLLNLWGRPAPVSSHPLVDTNFLNTATVRVSYSDLVRANEDLSDFDCYACHEKEKPPPLRFDANHKLIIPKEHANIVMEHGRHDRNNLCFNCHDEQNLERFQTRDGRELKFADSTALCGSCHGPSLRDWEAGAHGRINGFWNRQLGEAQRKDCVNCHNPHKPRFPGRKPAPPPNPLHPEPDSAAAKGAAH